MKHYITGIFFLFTAILKAQTGEPTPPNDNSPFSRLGLGDLVNQNFAASAAMGNLSATFQDAYHLNLQNPAASAFLKSTSYELGLNYRRSTIEDKVTSVKTNHGAINYLALGFPLKNQVNELFDKRKKSTYSLGMHFGLVPFSNIAYNVQSTKVVPNVGKTSFAYTGTGGTYKFFWGNSIAFKNVALGLNLGYLFGRSRSDRSIEFSDLQYYYQNRLIDNTTYRGFVWNIGTQYVYDFMKTGEKGKKEPSGKKLIFGIYGNSATNFNTVVNGIYTRTNYSYISNITGAAVDTILKERTDGITGKGKLPAEVSMGVCFQKGTKLRLGVNYTYGAWNQYKNDAKNETLSNTSRIGAGVEYTPEANSYNKYTRRISYRFGVNSWSDPRSLNNQQVKGTSASIGFGLPLILPRQQISFLNFGFEIGKLGTDALKQNYFKTTLGLTFNDNSWFYKRRFN